MVHDGSCETTVTQCGVSDHKKPLVRLLPRLKRCLYFSQYPVAAPQSLHVRIHSTTMTDAVPTSRDHTTEDPEARDTQIAADKAPSLDVKSLTDKTLHFLATASNETLGACLVGLGAGTYLVLGRVGLVLIGVVGGVVLHATWEGHGHDGEGDSKEQTSKNVETRRKEVSVQVAKRVLDWRDTQSQKTASQQHDDIDLSLKLYAGKTLDYSEFQLETAAALTELTDAVIRDYVKYVSSLLLYCHV